MLEVIIEVSIREEGKQVATRADRMEVDITKQMGALEFSTFINTFINAWLKALSDYVKHKKLEAEDKKWES